MSKLILMPNNLNQLEKSIALVNGFILGIDQFSVNSSFSCSEKTFFSLLKKLQNKEVFLLLNKNYQNKELPALEKFLKKLPKSVGILFYDLAILNINKGHDLYWHAEHFTTNYKTLETIDVKGMFVSNDLNLKEILEIRNHTSKTLFIQVFGHYPIFNAIRHLLDNYLNTFCLKKESNYYLEENNNLYPIVDNQDGTVIYSSKMINGLKHLNKLKKFNYLVINVYQIKDEDIITIIKSFKNNDQKTIQDMFKNIDQDFFEKKVNYKIKEIRK